MKDTMFGWTEEHYENDYEDIFPAFETYTRYPGQIIERTDFRANIFPLPNWT